MNVSTLNESLLNDIVSKQDAAKIVHSFNEAYSAKNLSQSDLILHHRLILCAATEHNHKELLEFLLSVFPVHLNSNPRPLFIAIHSGNIVFVEILINAGSSINPIGSDKETFALSAIEIACFYDQAEILQLLLSPRIKPYFHSRYGKLL